MPIVNQGWAYVSGSGAAATSPGGDTGDIQFNISGAFSGSNLLTTDLSGSLSASVNISASAFYGDGSNITGLTASAVNVADGPEQAIQFRVDTPVSGEISGSSAFMFMTASNTVKLDGAILSSSQNLSASGLYFGNGNNSYLQESPTSVEFNTGLNMIISTGTGITLQNTIQIPSDGVLSSSTHISASSFVVPDGHNIGSATKPGLMYLQAGTLQVDGDIEAGSGPGNETVRLRASGEVSGSGPAYFGSIQTSGSVTLDGGVLSSSANVSASAFYGDGANLTGISLINLDAAGSDTNIQFNQNGEFAADAGLAWDGTSSMTVSSSAWGTTATTYAGSPATSSNGGRVKLLGPSSSTAAYIGTDNLYVSIEGTLMDVSRLQIVNDGGMVNLSASMDVTVDAYADGEQYFEVNTNVASFTLYTGSLGGDDLEYVWSINSGHVGPEDESAWVKLDVSSSTKNFTVGPRDNIQLIANAGLKVANAASTFDSAATFNAQANFNGEVTASAGIMSDVSPSAGPPGLWLSASNPSFGPGEVYGSQWFGSGSNPGTGFTGASIGLSKYPPTNLINFEFRSKEGGATVRSDAGDTTIRATAGEVILSGSTRVISHTEHNFQGTANFNAAVNTNANLNVNNTSSFAGPATFDNTTNFNSAATFNSSLNAWGNVNIGNASSDSLTVTSTAGFDNMGNIKSTGSAITWQIADGADGLSGNGALMFFTGSGGDFMKFHTSGSAKGIVFPQQTYLSKGGALSGSAGGPGSFLALDSDNKVVLATPSAGGGGVFTEINGSNAATTSSIAVGTSGTPQATLQVSSSGNQALLAVAGATNGTVLFVTGSGRVGIGTDSPSRTLEISEDSTAAFQLTALNARGAGNNNSYSVISDYIGFSIFETSLGGTPAYRFNIADGGGTTTRGFVGIGNGAGMAGSTFPTAQLHVSASNGGPAFRVDGDAAAVALFVTASSNVGICTVSPKTSLDVHYTGSGNPTSLGDDTGGGDVVYFGTGSANLTVGGLYYLNSDGGWESADAALTGSGHNQLMGIALGTDPGSSGVLVKGYFHADSSFSGSFIKGGPVYIQSSSAGRSPTAGGYLSASAPTAEDSYVRVMGYGTDTANVIYFNPDSTYVEIGS